MREASFRRAVCIQNLNRPAEHHLIGAHLYTHVDPVISLDWYRLIGGEEDVPAVDALGVEWRVRHRHSGRQVGGKPTTNAVKGARARGSRRAAQPPWFAH